MRKKSCDDCVWYWDCQIDGCDEKCGVNRENGESGMNDELLKNLAIRILEFDDDEKKEFLNVLMTQAYQQNHKALEKWNWSCKIIDMVNVIVEEEKKRKKRRQKMVKQLSQV